MIWSNGTRPAYAASLRYAMLHLLGGVILFAGVTGHLLETGDATFTRMAADSISHWLILAGFLINAGAPPLSAWKHRGAAPYSCRPSPPRLPCMSCCAASPAPRS